MAVEDVKWYRCIIVPEKNKEEVNESEMNAFISYTFGANKTRNLRYYTPRNHIYEWEADYGWVADRYDFEVDRIYKVVGKYIMDDSGVSHELANIANCFAEFHLLIGDEVKALIERKEGKGDKIEITPLHIKTDERCPKAVYSITCCVIRGRRYMSVSREDTDAYEGIIRCYKTLRDSSPDIPHKIKDILEERIRKTKR